MFILAAVDHVVTFDDTLQWFGKFHLILLHFPLVLIPLTALSEWLFQRNHNPLFDNAARFMIACAAVFIIPTVLTGLSLGYVGSFEGAMGDLYWWHRALGLTSGALAIACFVFKELYIRGIRNTQRIYYLCLAILFITVSLTGNYGGEITFGPTKLIPPFLS